MNDLTPFLEYQAPEDLLRGQVIVVTGASDGIGRTAALTFARYGATVVLLGRTMSKLEKVYDEIEAAGGPQPAIFPINFESATPPEYDQVRQALETEFGRIDGLLHNAAQLGKRTPLSQYPFNEWQTVMQVNVTAPYLLTKALLPLMTTSRFARIVFTGSSVGVKGKAYWGAYSVSKGAVENLMEVLADELEETSVRVCSLNPGATRTAMRASAYPAENPLSVITADNIMNRYLFLFSPESREWHGVQLDAQPKKAEI